MQTCISRAHHIHQLRGTRAIPFRTSMSLSVVIQGTDDTYVIPTGGSELMITGRVLGTKKGTLPACAQAPACAEASAGRSAGRRVLKATPLKEESPCLDTLSARRIPYPQARMQSPCYATQVTRLTRVRACLRACLSVARSQASHRQAV